MSRWRAVLTEDTLRWSEGTEVVIVGRGETWAEIVFPGGWTTAGVREEPVTGYVLFGALRYSDGGAVEPGTDTQVDAAFRELAQIQTDRIHRRSTEEQYQMRIKRFNERTRK